MNRNTSLVLAAAAALWSCGGDPEGRTPSPASDVDRESVQQVANGPGVTAGPIEFESYQPLAEEQYPNGKRLAADIAQRVMTYGHGATPEEVARELVSSPADAARLSATIAPLVEPRMRSGGRVVYPQFSGVTASSLGAMVVVRQVLEDAAGRRRSETRVLDIRLRREDGAWQLEKIVSVGGRRRPRPADLSPAATRVADHPDITLSDSARWDLYGRRVNEALLARLAELAEKFPISISVLSSGHPRNVWRTDRRSAHTDGFAADIYAVNGRLVVSQQRTGSAAYELVRTAVAGRARQVGSPWRLGPGSFSDVVHSDHVHIQQVEVPGQGPPGAG